MAAISHASHTATEYLPKYFSKEAYLTTYAVMFKPIPDKVTWDPCDRPKLFPPEITKKIGRPKKSRKRAATEPIKKKNRSFYICCSFCGGMNHNVRKCPLRPSIARELRAQQVTATEPNVLIVFMCIEINFLLFVIYVILNRELVGREKVLMQHVLQRGQRKW